MDPAKSVKDQINIIQINLNHSIRATEQLKINQYIRQADITCIQEPYYLNNKIIGFSTSDTVVNFDYKPRTATIIHSNVFDIFTLSKERDLVILKLTTQNVEFIIVNAYAAPNENLNNMLYKIENLLTDHSNTQIIIVGDFNAKNPAWGGTRLDERGETITDFMMSNNLYLLNEKDSKPTFSTPNGNSWIDLTLVTPNLIREINKWEVRDEHTESDHNYIFIQLYTNFIESTKQLTKKGEILLIEAIKKANWFKNANAFTISTTQDLKNLIDTFYLSLEKLTKKYSRALKPKFKQNIWWTDSLNIERKKVRALRRRYQNSTGELREILKQKYHESATQYKQNIKKTKEDSWRNFVTEIVKCNIFSLPYKLACNKLRKPVNIPQIRKTDNSLTTSLTESIKYILDTLFQEENPQTHTQFQKSTIANLSHPPQTNDDEPFTDLELELIMNKIKPKVTPGPDNLKTNLVKGLYNANKEFFLKIFNAALEFGYFPIQWKNTKTILLNKKAENPELPSSYRPICITSILGKALEKLINNRIYHFLHKNKLLSKHQFGFTHNTSAVLAMYQIKQNILAAKESNLTSIIISLDITGAFNSLWTPFVLQILKNQNCPKNLFQITQSLLTNREITYYTKSKITRKKNILGCPQGSPISPLLWNLIISTLLNKTFDNNVQVQAFADDVTITTHGKTRKNIEDSANRTLDEISQWGKQHNLEFNPSKCKFIIIGSKYHKRPPLIKINNNNIKCVKELKILGVTFDPQLSFLPHLEQIKHKVTYNSLQLAKFSGLNWGISPNQFRSIYIRAIERIITYAAPIWYKSTNHSHQQRKLKSIQRIPLLKICQGFRTINNHSLNILCNVKPIKYTLEKETEMFYLYHLKKTYLLINITLKSTNYNST